MKPITLYRKISAYRKIPLSLFGFKVFPKQADYQADYMATASTVTLVRKCLSCVPVLLTLFGAAPTRAAPEPAPYIADAVPVVLRASDLTPSLHGIENNRISLMTYRKGKLVPIPFQIDEMDKTGLVFSDHQKQAPQLGKADVFDGEDEVVFMLGDAENGPAPITILQNYALVETLKVGLPGKRSAIVYVVLDHPERAPQQYVSADLAQGLLETESLKFKFNPQAFSDIQSIQLKNQQAKQSANLLDALSLKVSTGIINKNLRVNATLGEEITLKPLAIVGGAVRATVLVELRFRWLGMTLHRDQMGLNFYRRSVNVPTRFTTNSLQSARLFLSLLREPKIEFDLALGRLQGTTLEIDSYATPGRAYRGAIDGHMSVAEQQANQETFPGDYIWLASGQGWHSILTNTLPVVPGGLFDSYLKGLGIQVNYDDVRHPSHAFRAKVVVAGIPKKALSLLFEIDRLGLDRTENLAALLARIVARDKAGKLKKFDRINQAVIADRIAAGLIETPEDYITAFIADMDRISLRGVNRAQLNLAFRRAMQQFDSVEALQNMRLGPVVAALQQEAAALNLDLSRVFRMGLDNTVWFAQAQTGIDPLQFYAAASHIVFTPQIGVERVAESGRMLDAQYDPVDDVQTPFDDSDG